MIMNWIYLTEGAQALDQLTWTVVVVGIGIVFLSLLIVYWFFRYILTFILNLKFFITLTGYSFLKGFSYCTIWSSRANNAWRCA